MSVSICYRKKRLCSMDKISAQVINQISDGHGVIIGSSTVVSKKAHIEPKGCPGLVHILLAKDAGITYINQAESGRFIHIQLFHSPAEINTLHLANRVINTIYRFKLLIDPDNWKCPRECERIVTDISQNIYFCGPLRVASICDIIRNRMQLPVHRGYIRILADIAPQHYALINWLVEEMEQAVIFHGAELEPINRLIHIHAKRNPFYATIKSCFKNCFCVD